jgi:RsiW-degrading membrane proteinase PrsW (M82 family)
MIETPGPGPRRESFHWLSFLAALGGVLTILTAGLGTFLFLLSGLMTVFGPEEIAGEGAMLLSYAAVGVLVAILMFPVVILAIKRLSGQPTVPGSFLRRVYRLRRPYLLVGAYILLLALGSVLNSVENLDWLFMPVINVLVLSIPVALLLWLGTKNLKPSSLQRNWTVFGLGMTLSPVLIVTMELIAILVGLVGLIIYITAFSPELLEKIMEMTTVFQSATETMAVPEEAVGGFLQQPGVIAILLLFTAVIVPLIEESLKPIGVWLLAGRDLTPQDGWMLGLISGAGFALVENLGNLAVGQGWWFLVLARAGAAGLHMFNSAIIGYTFVLSRRKKRWRLVVLAFLGTLALHALWNSVAVFATVGTLNDPAGADLIWPIGYLIVMGLASLGTVIGIHRINRHLALENRIRNIESELKSNDRPDHAID